MGRNVKERRPIGMRPVEKVEESGKHLGLRFVAFLVCLTVGVGALGYGVYQWLSTEPGWVRIEANTGDVRSCGSEFAFDYLLTGDGFANTGHLRAVRAAYNQLAVRAYRLFTTAETVADEDDPLVEHNLCYINAHPNEEVEIDPVLYRALALVEEYDSRAVYLGPLYSVYGDLFFCQDDGETRDLDPFQSPEMAAFCRELADYAADPAHIRLDLLDGNRVKLYVSEEYLRYARDEGRDVFLDFGWLRTAFMADYMAESLASQGLDAGMLSSYDGVTRCLGGDIGQQVFNLYDWDGRQGIVAAQASFGQQRVNAVSLRTFPLNSLDSQRCYTFEDGELRHSYIDPRDGLCRAAVNSLALYGEGVGCGELALQAEPLLVAGSLDHAALVALPQDTGALAVDGQTVLSTRQTLQIDGLYAVGTLQYDWKYIGE